jgi:hypothetical protein
MTSSCQKLYSNSGSGSILQGQVTIFKGQVKAVESSEKSDEILWKKQKEKLLQIPAKNP